MVLTPLTDRDRGGALPGSGQGFFWEVLRLERHVPFSDVGTPIFD